MLNNAYLSEKLKNLTETKIDSDENEERLAKAINFLRSKEEAYTKLEEAISSLNKDLNKSKVKFPWDDDTFKKELLDKIDQLKETLQNLDKDIIFFKQKQVIAFVNLTSPELIDKLERVAEELDSLIENLELGLKFHKQFNKLEQGFKEYSKKAKKINLSKKLV